jgi:hypothetical protein
VAQVSGYLVHDVETCAHRCSDILRVRRGGEHVRERFPVPRHPSIFTDLAEDA